MNKILVSGLINIETTLLVDGFPITYSPVRYPFYGVNSAVSGVGFNIAAALHRLGSPVRLLSLVGRDLGGDLARQAAETIGLDPKGVLPNLEKPPQSIILYELSGRRQINVDLKDIQDHSYPLEIFEKTLADSNLAVLGNINFSRPLLAPARRAGKLIATDVHAISSLEDEYNQDFMAAADILFMSDELLPCTPEEWVTKLMDRYRAEIVVVGMGSQGALLSVRTSGLMERLPAVYTRPVASTIGAGDALFSAFLHFYLKERDPRISLQKAIVFASYKIGEYGAAQGFLDEEGLLNLYGQTIQL
jgi:acarbose 7IV-phosphotransferase